MRFLSLLLTLLLIAQPALAQSPFIYGGGGRAKSLSTNGITLKSGATLDSDGPENLVKNARAEDPTTPSGFSIYDDGASALPTDGTGGSPSIITTWTRDTTSGNLIQGNATWKLAKGSGDAQGEGWNYTFTIPDNHPMAKSFFAALNFDYYMSTTSGPAIRVYVYDVTNSTLITPSFTTCGGGSTPVLTATTTLCHAQLGFPTTTGKSYRVLLHVADTTSTAVNVFADNFLLTTEGGTQVGANVGPWQTFTPSFPGQTGGTKSGKWRRVGDSMEIEATVDSPSSWGVYQDLTMPTGYTIDTSTLTTSKTVVGTALTRVASTSPVYPGVVVVTNSTTMRPGGGGSQNDFWAASITSPSTYTSSQGFTSIHATVPIAEWAGGTAFGENKVEYACSTTGTWDAAAAAANTIYGASGCPITGALTASRTKVVRFQTPQQDGEVVDVYIKYNGSWVRASNIFPYTPQNSVHYGVQNSASSTANRTDFDVFFGQYSSAGATYGGTGNPWTSSSVAWLAVKHKAGVPVPFGLATSTTPGLYQAGAAPGSITGTATAAGYVGEVKTSTIPYTTTYSASATYENVTSLSMTAGNWLVSGYIIQVHNSTSSAANLIGVVSGYSGNTTTDHTNGLNLVSGLPTVNNNSDSALAVPMLSVRCDGTNLYIGSFTISGTTLYLKSRVTYTGTAPMRGGTLTAVRMP